MLSLVHELDTRACNQVLHRGGDQHLAWCGEGLDAGGDVHGQTGEVVAADLALAGVQSGSHLDAQFMCGLGDRCGAGDGPSGPVEARGEAVPGGVDLPPAESAQLLAHGAFVGIEGRAPSPVAEGGQVFGRGDDVGEEHRRQHAVDIDWWSLAGQELGDLLEDQRRFAQLVQQTSGRDEGLTPGTTYSYSVFTYGAIIGDEGFWSPAITVTITTSQS